MLCYLLSTGKKGFILKLFFSLGLNVEVVPLLKIRQICLVYYASAKSLGAGGPSVWLIFPQQIKQTAWKSSHQLKKRFMMKVCAYVSYF